MLRRLWQSQCWKEPLPSDPFEPLLEPLPEPSEESSEESPPDGGAAICLGKMRMLKLLATVPAVLAALIKNVKVPVAVGTPEMTPPANESPVGSTPPVTDQVMGVEPLASSVWAYAVSTAPSGRLAVVMTGAVPDVPVVSAGSMIMLRVLVTLPSVLAARTIKPELLTVVGVPEITPLASSLSPAGSVPLSSVQVTEPGAELLAASVCMYAALTVLFGRPVVVMTG